MLRKQTLSRNALRFGASQSMQFILIVHIWSGCMTMPYCQYQYYIQFTACRLVCYRSSHLSQSGVSEGLPQRHIPNGGSRKRMHRLQMRRSMQGRVESRTLTTYILLHKYFISIYVLWAIVRIIL